MANSAQPLTVITACHFTYAGLLTANEVGDNSLTVSSRKAGERQVSKQLVNLLNIFMSNARSHKQTN